jgi:Spy/CpxP family protein refolding chaperone
MKRSIWSAGVYLLLVFLSGAAVGGFAHRLYTIHTVQAERSPQEYRKRYVEDMTRRLGLSADQIARLGAILDETRSRYRELHERYRPEMKSIQEDQTQRIRTILSAAQQTEYEKMREEREKRRKQGGKFGF